MSGAVNKLLVSATCCKGMLATLPHFVNAARIVLWYVPIGLLNGYDVSLGRLLFSNAQVMGPGDHFGPSRA